MVTGVIPEAINVWCENLDRVAASRGAELGALLSREESVRARHLGDARSRRRYVAGREMLRLILGEECGIDPAHVVFAYGPRGKPSMSGAPSTFFNMAHCDGLSVVAATSAGEVGIDIERLREDVDVDRIAPRMFSVEDMRGLAALSRGERVRAFFDGWVRIEALVKGMGIGLLPRWKFRADLRTSPADGRADIERDEINGWKVCVFSPSPDSTGCVAVQAQRPINVRLRSLSQVGVVARLDQTRGRASAAL
jgi:4'-phosphopantetheinyl transferase